MSSGKHKPPNTNKSCRVCSKETPYISPKQGYRLYCNMSCYNLDKKNVLERYSLERFGTRNPFQATEVKQQIVRRMIEKYGVDNPSKAPEVKSIKYSKSMAKYGTPYVIEAKEVQEKIRQTCLDKYGVEDVMHAPQIATRAALKSGKAHSQKYTTKFGNTVIVQGNLEKEFVRTCEENNIPVLDGPVIYYSFYGKKKRYFIDFKICVDGRWHLVELKSSYWYQKLKEQTEVKVAAAKQWAAENNYASYVMMIDEVYIPTREQESK